MMYPELWRVCYPGNNASCIMVRLVFGTELVLYLVLVSGTLVTVVGNFIVIVSVCHFKQLHCPTNVLIVSLALADFLVGVIVMPFGAVLTVDGCWYYGEIFCQLYSSFDLFFTMLSIFHLICIAVDRYQAICNPLHYSQKITMSVAVIMICVIWTVATVFTFVVVQSPVHVAELEESMEEIKCLGDCFIEFNNHIAILWTVLSFFFPCFVMICLYTQIFIVAKRHARKIREKNNCSNDRRRGGLIKQSENKAAKTLSIVLGAFIFCWMPHYLDFLFGFDTPFLLTEIFIWMGYFNSALNPIIYALFYPCFTKCFLSIITLKIFNSNSKSMNLPIK